MNTNYNCQQLDLREPIQQHDNLLSSSFFQLETMSCCPGCISIQSHYYYFHPIPLEEWFITEITLKLEEDLKKWNLQISGVLPHVPLGIPKSLWSKSERHIEELLNCFFILRGTQINDKITLEKNGFSKTKVFAAEKVFWGLENSLNKIFFPAY